MHRSAERRFSEEILPHLDAAYSLARWLTRSEHDAEDIVQEAMVKALRGIGGYQGLNAHGWLLAIVRTTAFTWLRKHRAEELQPMHDELPSAAETQEMQPDAELIRREHRHQVQRMLDRLPIHLREVLLLREVEGLPYKTIAEVIGTPIGTVMSRLSRAREQLSQLLATVVQDA
jgi:RNA polymerase sigma-70 factor (ECF subfamily)